jgi:hypothetical protein
MTVTTGVLAAAGTLSSQAGASQTVTKTVNFKVSCSLGVLGSPTFPASLTGTYPTSVKSGSKFSATKVHGYIQVPSSLDKTSYAFGNTYKANLNPINANSSDATPAVINGAGPSGINVHGNVPGPPYPGFKLNIPQSGSITVGPWTAGAKGKDTVTFGTAAATIHLYKNGVQTVSVNGTCAKPANVVLATISVT